MTFKPSRWIALLVAVAIVVPAGYYAWLQIAGARLPEGIVSTNGRLEAEQVQIAAKYAGRVVQILANEGDWIEAGTVLARMDDTELQAQLRSAEAQVTRGQQSKAQAEALIVQRESERILARQQFERAQFLHQKGYFTTENFDQRRSQLEVAEAAHRVAVATRDDAEATIAAAQAEVARIKSMIGDMVLIAPRSGRIQYKLVQPGEVVGAGASVLTLLDLTNVYMTVFLPANAAGRLALGSEARLVLDPAPQYVIPATVTFVAADAQFTPKSVETAEERDKLMFRVKLTIPLPLLEKYEKQVKTGVRGIAYVRVRQNGVWPANLAVKLPNEAG